MKKKSLLFILLSMYLVAGATDLTGTWEGIFMKTNLQEYGETKNIVQNLYQHNDTIEGIVGPVEEGSDRDAVFAILENDSIKGYMFNDEENEIVNITGVYRNDSIFIEYQSTINPDRIGIGIFSRTKSDLHTLIVNYDYTGTDTNKIVLGLFENQYDLINGNEPVAEYTSSSRDGKFVIPGIQYDTCYVALYTNYDSDYSYFNDYNISIALYGNVQTMEPSPVIINKNESFTIDIAFDDTYTFSFPASFPGGKLELLDTIPLGYYPGDMITDSDGYFYLTDGQYSATIYKYDPNFKLIDTLTDSNGDDIKATEMVVNSKGETITSTYQYITIYSSAGEMLNQIPRPEYNSKIAKLSIDSADNIFINLDTIIYKYLPDLSGKTDSLAISQIINDYPAFADSDPGFNAMGFNNNGDLTLLIDVESDKYNALLYYSADMSTFIKAVWEEWLLLEPKSIAFDENNNAYIVDCYGQIVIVLDETGSRYAATYYRKEEGNSNGAMSYPENVIIRDDTVFVNDKGNNRISVYSVVRPTVVQSEYMINFYITDGSESIDDVTVTFNGRVYTGIDGSIGIENTEAGIYSFTASAEGYTEKSGTITISDSDVTENIIMEKTVITLLCSETTDNRLTVFPNPMTNSTKINIKGSAEFVKIYDIKGRIIKTFVLSQQNTYVLLTWNGNGKDNTPVKPGIYFIRVKYPRYCKTVPIIKQ